MSNIRSHLSPVAITLDDCYSNELIHLGTAVAARVALAARMILPFQGRVHHLSGAHDGQNTRPNKPSTWREVIEGEAVDYLNEAVRQLLITLTKLSSRMT